MCINWTLGDWPVLPMRVRGLACTAHTSQYSQQANGEAESRGKEMEEG